VFGLPGNPVSSYIGFLIFVLPVIQYRNGALKGALGLNQVKVNLGGDIENIEDRVNYILGNIYDGKNFLKHCNQRSNNILALSNSNALVRFEPRIRANNGDEVTAILLP
jgi:molybdopterin molybdotransferase